MESNIEKKSKSFPTTVAIGDVVTKEVMSLPVLKRSGKRNSEYYHVFDFLTGRKLMLDYVNKLT